MTPASETARSASATTMSEGSSALSMPSRVTSFSPRRALRTTMRLPASRSRSKAWSGWPISHIT